MATRYQSGLRVHEYVLEECLGAGAFGEVWRARHHVTQSIEVAVKLPIENEYVRFLKHEGDLVHGLRHPNIVSVLGIDPYADTPYLVMELVKGPNLRQVLEQRPEGVPHAAAVAILRGVLRAMQAAHAAGVVHRDLKPANVLLHLAGSELETLEQKNVKVSDFGLGTGAADMLVSIAQSMSINRDEHLVGTLAYMAPELRDGKRDADARTDLYSIGVMLFELLTGQRPAGIELPSALRRDAAPALDAVFRRLFIRYELRYESAAATLEDLNRQLERGGDVADRAGPAAIAGTEVSAKRVTTGPAGLTLDLGTGVALELVHIPAGGFLMGTPESEDCGNEQRTAQRRVSITHPFYMGKCEVTQAQWKALMGENRSHHQGDQRPVEFVKFTECRDSCERLSARVGREVRLPTEAEWEYACRAGTTTAYHFGDRISSATQANYEGGRQGELGRGYERRRETTPVGSFPPNAWGLHDMHGNVREWCTTLAPDDAAEPPRSECVLRGGSYSHGDVEIRSASRLERDVDAPYAYQTDGFRVVAPIETRVLDLGNDVTMELMPVPAGEFLMGSPIEEDGSKDTEGPQHGVRITRPFYMARFTVTVPQWRAVMGSIPRVYKNFYLHEPDDFWRKEHPMTYVSHEDCLVFCRKLSERAGCELRLPTEAEWEYACRAGSTTPYAFGSALSAEQANCRFSGGGIIRPVGQYPPNAWGLCDMHGNVLEWCSDWVGQYAQEEQIDPAGPAGGSTRITHSAGFRRSPDQRIQRGGDFEHGPEKARSASRDWQLPALNNQVTGFRVVTLGGSAPRPVTVGEASRP